LNWTPAVVGWVLVESAAKIQAPTNNIAIKHFIKDIAFSFKLWGEVVLYYLFAPVDFDNDRP
jgi:hypothetical protein